MCVQFVITFCLCAFSVLVLCARHRVFMLHFVAGKLRDHHLQTGTREVNIKRSRFLSLMSHQ